MYEGITMKKHFISICFLLFILISCGKTQERICFIEEENRFDDSSVIVHWDKEEKYFTVHNKPASVWFLLTTKFSIGIIRP